MINNKSLETIRGLVKNATDMRHKMRDVSYSPETRKVVDMRFSVTEAVKMCGKSKQTIIRAEEDGRLPAPEKDARGHRTGYSLASINRMRTLFGTLPGRAPDEEPVILAVQSFKGGVGKSTISVLAAQYLALKGHRVLLVDCDPQGSSTQSFGLIPDEDVKPEETMLPYITGEQPDLRYAIQNTYWDSVDLIPSNLFWFSAEYRFSEYRDGNFDAAGLFRDGIREVQDDYDVIILDPPPALGFISLSVMHAANALLIPAPPSLFDYYSTISFLKLMQEFLEDSGDEATEYKFIRLLITRYDENNAAERMKVEEMGYVFAHNLNRAAFLKSAEILSAANLHRTVLELDGPATGNNKTHRRCKLMIEAVMEEIEALIRSTWPSQRDNVKYKNLFLGGQSCQ